MFPQSLVAPIIALGSVCIIICITIFHYFKERVDNHIRDNIIKLFSKKEVNEFIKGINEGKVTDAIVKDFYKDLIVIWKPKQLLKNLWISFPLSGIIFICIGLIITFFDTNNYIYIYLLYSLSSFAIVVLIFGVIQLIRLGVKLL